MPAWEPRKHTCRNRRMSFSRGTSRRGAMLFIPRQFIFFNRAISPEPFPPLCPRLYNKYSFFRSWRFGWNDNLPIPFAPQFLPDFFLNEYRNVLETESAKKKIYSRKWIIQITSKKDATKDRLIVPSLATWFYETNCTIEQLRIEHDSHGPRSISRMSPIGTFGTIDLNQLLAPFRIAKIEKSRLLF